MDPPDIMTELGYLDEVRMEALVASQIGAVGLNVVYGSIGRICELTLV
jgi:hypothetical protein